MQCNPITIITPRSFTADFDNLILNCVYHTKVFRIAKQNFKRTKLESLCCTVLSCSVMSNSLRPHGLYSPWNSPGQNIGVGSISLLQRIFPAQGLNWGLLHCRWILYQLSHQRSPRILEWVAYPFSRGTSPPRNRTGVSHITGRAELPQISSP